MKAQTTVIQDGQTYYPGEEIWDLGSIRAVSGLDGSIRHYEGKQEDFNKLPQYVSGGSTCFMIDTGKYYRFDEKTKTWNDPKTITNRFVKADEVHSVLLQKIQEISGDISQISKPLIWKGTVASAELLPISPEIGWVYNIETKSIYGEAGMNVAWNGSLWDPLGQTIDVSLFLKSADIAGWAKQPQKPKYTANEVGAEPKMQRIEKTTSDTNVTLEANKLYVFPEMATLSIQLKNVNGYAKYQAIFQSGATATVLSFPENVKSDLTVEINKIYKIEIVENLLTWSSWAV